MMRYLLTILTVAALSVAAGAQQGWVLVQMLDAEYEQAWVEALCDNAVLDAVDRGELPAETFGTGAAHGGGLTVALFGVAVFTDSAGVRYGGISGHYATPWMADLLRGYVGSLTSIVWVPITDGYTRIVDDTDEFGDGSGVEEPER